MCQVFLRLPLGSGVIRVCAMEQVHLAIESIRNWWFDLQYSQNQKRALLIIGAVLIVLSSVIVFRGNTEASATPEIVPVTVTGPLGQPVAGFFGRLWDSLRLWVK